MQRLLDKKFLSILGSFALKRCENWPEKTWRDRRAEENVVCAREIDPVSSDAAEVQATPSRRFYSD